MTPVLPPFNPTASLAALVKRIMRERQQKLRAAEQHGPHLFPHGHNPIDNLKTQIRKVLPPIGVAKKPTKEPSRPPTF